MTLPKISIVTPSFNQARFLERTLRSVLEQGYPNLEYIVIDGGSTDGSVEILRRYADRLAWWESAPDGGQSNALNKGFARATGEVLGWLNSDDVYCPGALAQAGRRFAANRALDVFYGGLYLIDAEDRLLDAHWAGPCDLRYTFHVGLDIHQQALFWRRELMDRIGGIDEAMHFSMDVDLIVRLLLHGRTERTRDYLGSFRVHDEAKTATIEALSKEENRIIQTRYRDQVPLAVPPAFARWNRAALSARRIAAVLAEAPAAYWAFKLGRRLGLPVPASWLYSRERPGTAERLLGPRGRRAPARRLGPPGGGAAPGPRGGREGAGARARGRGRGAR
ncbi:MAG: glycosyltransferase family 2 protein, partial [Blastocatellia bacterium]|nr:glycosyltransferase family 2 protein [Blastocatellia bacterium]